MKINHSLSSDCKKFEYSLKEIINESKTTRGKVMLAAGLGFGMYFYQWNSFLFAKTLEAFELPPTRPDPFGDMSIPMQILLIPIGIALGPIAEEIAFRKIMQERIGNKLKECYQNKNSSESMAHLASRATSIFLTTLIFAGLHFINVPCSENPLTVCAQSTLCLSGGITLGLAKELSGGMLLPISLHVGNNIAAWANNLQYAWSRA